MSYQRVLSEGAEECGKNAIEVPQAGAWNACIPKQETVFFCPLH